MLQIITDESPNRLVSSSQIINITNNAFTIRLDVLNINKKKSGELDINEIDMKERIELQRIKILKKRCYEII